MQKMGEEAGVKGNSSSGCKRKEVMTKESKSVQSRKLNETNKKGKVLHVYSARKNPSNEIPWWRLEVIAASSNIMDVICLLFHALCLGASLQPT